MAEHARENKGNRDMRWAWRIPVGLTYIAIGYCIGWLTVHYLCWTAYLVDAVVVVLLILIIILTRNKAQGHKE